MKLVITQPAYIPWLGFFDKIMQSDCVVLLDTVQMDWSSKTKFTNRNRIRSPHGTQWLTIPVLSKGDNRFLPIRDLAIESSSWVRKHLQAMRLNYAKAPFFNEYFDEFGGILSSKEWSCLGGVLEPTLDWFFGLWGLRSKIIWAHDIEVSGEKAELILNICKKMGATQYLSGPFGRSYLDEGVFIENGIELLYHDFEHPVYSQGGADFVPYLSSLDALFFLGRTGVEEMLRSN